MFGITSPSLEGVDTSGDSLPALRRFLLQNYRRTLRRLLESDGLSTDEGGMPFQPEVATIVVPPEARRLYDLLMTFAVGIVLTIAGQCTIVWLWRHVINKRYYKAQRQVKPEAEEEEEVQKVPVWLMLLVPVCFWSTFSHWLKRQRRKRKPPKFVPFPKSLLHPTPLFFTCAVFTTGLTRAAVTVLAVQPEGCDSSCLAIAFATLCGIGLMITFAAVDLAILMRTTRAHVNFKPGETRRWRHPHAKSSERALAAVILSHPLGTLLLTSILPAYATLSLPLFIPSSTWQLPRCLCPATRRCGSPRAYECASSAFVSLRARLSQVAWVGAWDRLSLWLRSKLAMCTGRHRLS